MSILIEFIMFTQHNLYCHEQYHLEIWLPAPHITVLTAKIDFTKAAKYAFVLLQFF